MRDLTDVERLHELMASLGREARRPGRVCFTGGATALLLGWRSTTIDVDLSFEGDAEALLQFLPHLKESLRINIEMASPADFIPELPGWRDRCLFVARHGLIDFYHYDLYSQALSKIERDHLLDAQDVAEMLKRGLVERSRLLDLFERIEPQLYRYPAIDAASFRKRVEAVVAP